MRFEEGNPSVWTPYPFGRAEKELGKTLRMAGEVFDKNPVDYFQPVFRLNTRDLMIPPPSQEFKSNPRYTPTMLPGLIDREILTPGFMGGGGFGVT